MNLAIVHEWLTNLAGSEKVVAALREAFPSAPVATSVWWPAAFRGWDVRPTQLQRLVRGPRDHERLLPLIPPAWKTLRLPDADTYLTSFHTFALYARVPKHARHLVYCHTPPRFLWRTDQLEGDRLPLPPPLAAAARAALRPLDVRHAAQPERFLANSRTTARRIEQAYRRDAEVVPPPVDVERFHVDPAVERDDAYVVVSRLVRYKRVDLAVAAFTRMRRRLVVVGTGREEQALRAIAGPTIEFRGHVPDHELPGVMAAARGLVFPGEEDFGIVPVEAMAAGTPVVAFRRGGATETVEEGTSGVFFDHPDVDALIAAVREADAVTWDRGVVARSAERFSTDAFIERIRRIVAA